MNDATLEDRRQGPAAARSSASGAGRPPIAPSIEPAQVGPVGQEARSQLLEEILQALSHSRGALEALHQLAVQVPLPGNDDRAAGTRDRSSLASEGTQVTGAVARLADLATQSRMIGVHQRLTEEVVRTSDLRRALRALNAGVCKEMGVKCDRVVFVDPELAATAGARRPQALDSEIIRAWQASPHADTIWKGDRAGLPIRVGRRVVGVLWVRILTGSARGRREFLAVLADGIGQIAYKAKLRRTGEERARRLAIAGERERMARHQFDATGQVLYEMTLLLQDLLAELRDGDADQLELQRRLGDLRAQAGQGVMDLLHATYSHAALTVRERGLTSSLRALLDRFARETGIHAELRVHGVPDGLTAELEDVVYRAAHELMGNIERHARATGVVADLCVADPVVLEIRDDGVDLDQRGARDWRSAPELGLRAIRRAIAGVGGTLEVGQLAPRGIVIRVVIPTSEPL